MLQGQIPPTEQLFGTMSVARHGSFTKAAQELGLSQPALSRQVMSLEKQIGIKIFDRVGRSVRLTNVGEEFINKIEPLLEEISRLTVNLAASGGTMAGRVRLGATESVAVHALPAILRGFLQQNKRVALRLLCKTSELLPDLVSNGDIDIAVTAVEHDAQTLRSVKLWSEDIVLVLPTSHKARSRNIASYANEDFVLLPSSTITRRLIDTKLREKNVQLKVALEHSSPEVIKAMVTAGMGLAILPEPTVRKEVRRGELVAWPLNDLEIKRDIVALSDPRREPWPAEEVLLKALQDYGR
ncbi:MAG: LysR family transcriptional regulator [Planctomycetes bacterium]|nr:LysR family transcriptional regulator [Planctomycetota bacterium]